jgi:heterodisulfide reductase subunit A
MDVRTSGKGYEEFYRRASEEYGAHYVRGRVSRIYPKDGKLVVLGEDTLLGRKAMVQADLVVLATAMTAQPDSGELARKLGISYDQHGFLTEAHPKLRPVETNTAGIFLAGACQGPKDIPDTVAQASAAAAKAGVLLSRESLETEAMIAQVDEARCSGCLWCEAVCPYKAIKPKTITERVAQKTVARTVAEVNPSLCHGCGACTVACRDGALNLLGFTNEQLLAEVEAVCL